MKRLTPILVVTLLAGCVPADPSDADDAQEAVVRHLAGRAVDGPWEAICLNRKHGAAQEDEATFQRRFDGPRLSVVPARLCAAAEGDSFDWVVEDTDAIALEIILRSVRRNVDGSLLVSAGTSTGTMDYAEYDCTLVRYDDSWQVEDCVVTITT